MKEILVYGSLIFYFCSFLGYFIEVFWCYLGSKKFVNRGFLCGPVIPIYGLGAVLILFCLLRYYEDPVVVFVFGVIITSALEYFTSFLLEKIFHNKWWDYSNRKYNLNGRICLQNSFAFGILSLVIIYIVTPGFYLLFSLFSFKVWTILSIIFTIIFILDVTYSVIIAYNLRNRIIIVEELKNEKIDIVRYSQDPVEYIVNALSPARIISVDILADDENRKEVFVIVPDDQLSLAIGREGQNVRLAHRLTGWKIDIKSETQARAMEDEREKQMLEEMKAQEEQQEQAVEQEVEQVLEEDEKVLGEAQDEVQEEQAQEEDA